MKSIGADFQSARSNRTSTVVVTSGGIEDQSATTIFEKVSPSLNKTTESGVPGSLYKK